ncbi:MAG: phosphatidylinositol-specific phospholipase C/glycerophosphodiester phosphodiesterase family protein [Planctomycetota bacterium]|nr:phosphatidylinositol-specific phospholipase C/glycerophosphodiester phosphodiesterase family protein [Planctomycetota bacterium]
MLFIQHRVNTIEQLKQTPTEFGVEIDLRDRGDRLIVVHDPFSDGEDFERWLDHYHHALVILNVKSERIEHRVLELVKTRGITSYFFLDSSFPMMRLLSKQGENNLAVRFSEFEPVEGALAMAGQARWAWIDCFTKMPLTESTYGRLKPHFKLCAVSPELQGRAPETIASYARELQPFPMDAVCTKRPDLWQAALGKASGVAR